MKNLLILLTALVFTSFTTLEDKKINVSIFYKEVKKKSYITYKMTANYETEKNVKYWIEGSGGKILMKEKEGVISEDELRGVFEIKKKKAKSESMSLKIQEEGSDKVHSVLILTLMNNISVITSINLEEEEEEEGEE